MLRTLRAFWHDQRGVALILVSIMLPAIIGFSLLVIDMSRANNLHNDLQKAADAFALAAAAELDGSSGAWARAERAMDKLVKNRSYFSTADVPTLTAGQPGGAARCSSAGSISWCFLKALPANDSAAVTSTQYADADKAKGEKETAYIEVAVTPAGFRSLFPASFLTGNAADNAFNVGAKAVAGFKSSVCDYTPVFICNPFELAPNGVTLEMAANNQLYRRRQIKLRGDGFNGPGNFAFLRSPDADLEHSLAAVKPKSCYSKDGVDTKPGQNAGPVERGLNSRFGLSAGYVGVYGPAKNTRMGIKNVQCNKNGNGIKSFDWETVAANGMGMPRDGCFAKGSCTALSQGGKSTSPMIGDGDWKVDADYWKINHTKNGVTKPWPAGISATSTRYEIYRAEAADPTLTSDASPSGETGVPACGMVPDTTVDRRILYGAILDCVALGNLNGQQNNLPVRAFGSFFLTEPIKDGKDIFVELVDITGKGGRGTLDNFLRDEAQLYR